MAYVLIITLIIVLIASSYAFFGRDLGRNVSPVRYFNLSSRPNEMSVYDNTARLLHLVFLLSASVFFTNLLLFGGTDTIRYMTVTNLIVFFLLDESFDFLHLTRKNQTILTYIKVVKYIMTNFLVLFFCIMTFVIDSSKTNILEIATYQNYIHWNIPMWNVVKFFPVFAVWAYAFKDKLNLLKNAMGPSELDYFQLRSIYLIKVVAWLMITLCLFFAGSGTLMMLDNVDVTKVNYISAVVVLAKALILIGLYKALTWLNIIKNEVETELVGRRRLKLSLIIVGILVVYKVVVQ